MILADIVFNLQPHAPIDSLVNAPPLSLFKIIKSNKERSDAEAEYDAKNKDAIQFWKRFHVHSLDILEMTLNFTGYFFKFDSWFLRDTSKTNT